MSSAKAIPYPKHATTCRSLTLFFETASAGEIAKRLRGEVYVTRVEVAIG